MQFPLILVRPIYQRLTFLDCSGWLNCSLFVRLSIIAFVSKPVHFQPLQKSYATIFLGCTGSYFGPTNTNRTKNPGGHQGTRIKQTYNDSKHWFKVPKRDGIYSFLRHLGPFGCITTVIFSNIAILSKTASQVE